MRGELLALRGDIVAAKVELETAQAAQLHIDSKGLEKTQRRLAALPVDGR